MSNTTLIIIAIAVLLVLAALVSEARRAKERACEAGSEHDCVLVDPRLETPSRWETW